MKLFVFGVGFSATAAINKLAPQCKWVAGTTRSVEKAADMKAKGIRAHIFDGTPATSALIDDLQSATHLLISIAPPRLEGPLEESKDPVLEHFADQIAASKNLEWIGYYSTVGVYGNHDGTWIDETAERRPVSARSKARVAAEDAWQYFAAKQFLPLSILRLAGIYGPGRNAFVNFKEGRARRIIKHDQVFNRIHVADIASITEAMALQKANAIFNGADNEPAPPQDVVEYAAGLNGAEVPPDIPFADANLSPMGRSFYGENKRVSNAKVKQELGVEFQFPSYREALQNLWQSGTWDQRDPLEKIT